MDRLGRLLVGLAGRHRGTAGPVLVGAGLPPALLDPVEGGAEAGPPVGAPATGPVAPFAAGRQAINDGVLSKLLHAWLQNRHQTLFPLALNVRSLDPGGRVTLARMTALLLLAEHGHGCAEAPPARKEAARRWLVGAGAEADTLHAMDEALRDPPATSRVIDAVLAYDLAPYAYVAALICLDLRDRTGQSLAEYLAARLALPPTLVRSANRRYGRDAATG